MSNSALSRPSSWPALHPRLLSVLDLVLGAGTVKRRNETEFHDAGGAGLTNNTTDCGSCWRIFSLYSEKLLSADNNSQLYQVLFVCF